MRGTELFRFVLCLACGLGLWLVAPALSAASGDPPPYASELIASARQARLWEQRYWHLLLHYQPNLLGGVTSEQDDPGFFRSPEGKTDPQAELEATLVSFFSDELVGRSKQPARCAFPARYEWLRDQLAFDESRMPPRQCERFDNWLRELNAEGVSVIFPSAFMNNPSSMFGHTLLRLDQRGQTEQTRILAYTVNYAADVPADEGILFPIKGIFGFYRGNFSTIPYYLKVKEYRDLENRDIWEYRLNFPEPQVRRMLTHAWELGNAYFDYFFFKENCAYHLLSLLEIADPSLHLQEQFTLWTVPTDTLRLLAKHPGLVSGTTYRPSRSTQIRQRRRVLTDEERAVLSRVLADGAPSHAAELNALAPERRALVLDIASDMLLYRSAKDPEHDQEYKARNIELLGVRSGIKARPPLIPIVPLSASPEQGHETHRAGVSIGWRNNELFEEVQLRAAYHDLLDPDTGYLPDAQIEMAGISVRHYEGQDQYRVERLTAVNIVSIAPIDAAFRQPSWKLNVGMQSLKPHRPDAGCRYCSTGIVSGGVGGAVESQLFRRLIGFSFAEFEGDVGGGYDDFYRIGGGGTVGVLAQITERWKLLASATYLRFPIGDKSDDVRASVGQRYTISRNVAVRLEYNHRRHDDEALLTLHAFF